jgi:hypothetical protein
MQDKEDGTVSPLMYLIELAHALLILQYKAAGKYTYIHICGIYCYISVCTHTNKHTHTHTHTHTCMYIYVQT